MSARADEAPLAETSGDAPIGAEGVFSGYASLFNVADMGRDVILPGAFARSLKRRGPRGVKMLYQHDPAEPIGQWFAMTEDRRGLCVTGRLMLELARAREVHALMRAGVLDGLSIGFRTLRGRRDAATGLRRLHEIDLWEISLVTFPMQEAARVATLAAERPAGGGTMTTRALTLRLGRAARVLRGGSRTTQPRHR